VLALFVVIAIVVVAGVAVLVVRDRPLITDDPVGSRALVWSTHEGVRPQDLAEVRFAVALRGYRMDEVDRVLDDTREALAARDARIADLQRVVAALGVARSGSGDAVVPTTTAADGS
jgi:DivIVA domain-containing protein